MIYSAALPAGALKTDLFPSVDGAESVYLCHVESGVSLIQKNMTGVIAPASTVKMMAGLLAVELLADDIAKEITVTENMVIGAAGTSMRLEAGTVISVEALLYGMICGGFNDAAQAIAVLCDGSVEAFTERMNQHAKDLGMLSTHYTNPTGWDDPKMRTTLYDISLLAKVTYNNERYMAISSDASYTFFHSTLADFFTVHNRNALVSNYYANGYQNRYAKGLIAGMTDDGGYCVVSGLEYDGTNYLCIVMGAKAVDGEIYSFKIANELLSYLYRYHSYILIAEKGAVICELPVQLAVHTSNREEVTVLCELDRDVYALLPDTADLAQDLQYKWYFHTSPLAAPITMGTVVGGVDIYYDGEIIATAALIAAEDVETNSILLFMA